MVLNQQLCTKSATQKVKHVIMSVFQHQPVNLLHVMQGTYPIVAVTQYIQTPTFLLVQTSHPTTLSTEACLMYMLSL